MVISARDEGFTPEQIDEMVQPELEQYRQTCVNALMDLDRKGFFGQGVEREKTSVVLAFTGYADIDTARTLINL